MPLTPAFITRQRRVLALALPIILSNISEPLLGAVDTAVVGQLPTPIHIGAVAIGATLFSFLFWGFGFLRMGTTGITAQAFGAGDARDLAAALARPFLLAIVLALPLMLLQGPIGWAAFELFEASDATETLAEQYFTIRIWSAPAALANYVLLGWLLGVGRTGMVLFLQILLNGANILLDLLFVLGFDWGVAGVAWATVIAQYLALAGGLLVIARVALVPAGTWQAGNLRALALFDPLKLRRLLRINVDIFLRTVALLIAFTWFTVKSTELGDLTLAANAVLYNIFGLLAYGLDGFAWAAEARGGRASGARDRLRYREAIFDTTLWAALLAGLASLAIVLVGPVLIDVMTVDPAVRAASRTYLLWAAAIPLLGVWSFMLDGIYIGATRTAEMRNGMLISLAVYLAAVWALLPVWGNDGLWGALMLFFVVRAVTLGYWLPRIERAIIAR
ncbi:MAG: MATE family efflux transporter [Dongiaceae bacterium]